MINLLMALLLTLLCAANVFLIYAVAYCGKGKADKTTRTGFAFMAVVLVPDMIFSVGGALLW